MAVRRTMLSRSNRLGVWLYRRTSGVAGGGAVKTLVLTVAGRRSGEPRSTCVAYLETADGLLVWGTASGAPRDPDWFHNLRAASVGEVQIGARRVAVVPRELLGDERDAAWATILGERPGVARYAGKSGRVIPVALLTPA